MKRISLVVRSSYDVFVKPTYALLKKQRTGILRLIVRSFFVKLAPGLAVKKVKVNSMSSFEQSWKSSKTLCYILKFKAIEQLILEKKIFKSVTKY